MNLRMVALLGVLSLSACGGGDGRSATAPALPTPYYGTPCSEFDSGADGTVDTVYTNAYDADGFLTRETTSAGYVTDYTYDDDHFYLHGVTSMSGATTNEVVYTRDPDGRVLTYMQTDFTGTPPAVTSSSYTYDTKGRIVSLSRSDSGDVTTSTFTYSGNHLNPATGRVVSGDVTTSYVYTTSADDRTLHSDADQGDDGTIDGTIETTYDADHRVLTQMSRSQGAFQRSDVVTYTSNGFVATSTQDQTEGDPVDYAYMATFDSKGHMATNEGSSPSGAFAGVAFRETAKETCVTLRRIDIRPGSHQRPMRDDRPVLPIVVR